MVLCFAVNLSHTLQCFFTISFSIRFNHFNHILFTAFGMDRFSNITFITYIPIYAPPNNRHQHLINENYLSIYYIKMLHLTHIVNIVTCVRESNPFRQQKKKVILMCIL